MARSPQSSSFIGEYLSRLAGVPGGRRTKWVMLVLWLTILAAVGPFAGELQSVEENDSAAFLPSEAESLKVDQIQQEHLAGEFTPAVIVYQRDGGLTEQDMTRIESDRQMFSEEFPESPPSETTTSAGGDSAFYAIPLPDDDDILDKVDGIRADLDDGEDGLAVKVTGPAGFLTDLVKVFDGIDTTLLGAAALVVTVLLLITYRSPFLWLIPIFAVLAAHVGATAVVYGLAKHAGLTVNGQSGGIMPILVFGAGTDYALLLIARYREELRRHEDKHKAMGIALRRAAPAILASGGTVVIGLLTLTAADLTSTRGLGMVGAAGITAAMLSLLILLPALLVIFGRRAFWPFIPRYGDEVAEGQSIWGRIGAWVDRRPRVIWAGTVIVLLILALGLFRVDLNLAQHEQFSSDVEAIDGQELIAESFAAGASSPATVIADQDSAGDVEEAILATSGVTGAERDAEANGYVSFSATMDAEPGSAEAFDIVRDLRDNVHAVSGANALVGGPDATNLDTAEANSRDRMVVMPLVLLVVLLVLFWLLRSVVAPLLLIATVVISYAASLGMSVLAFDYLFGFPAMDSSVPLLSFVFLVALGIDYNIFLMSRVHEESEKIGTHAGMLKGLAVTGGVITSAGIVLAATFAVLGVLPLVAMVQLGFVVAFGVLLDALIVRSILVPALTLDFGRRIWWPSKLAAGEPEPVASAGQRRSAIGD